MLCVIYLFIFGFSKRIIRKQMFVYKYITVKGSR
jgi:hypothetical protein